MRGAQEVLRFALFDTALGTCAIGWRRDRVAAVRLPESTRESTARSLRLRHPDAVEGEPPAAIAAVVARIVRLLGGERVDLADVPLDLDGVPEFNRRVYAVALAIPPGGTVTYGEVAGRLGDKGAAQAVGRALGENPIPIIVPCHRVLAAGGRSGGFSAPGGAATKLKLLEIEGAAPMGQPSLFSTRHG